MIFISLAKFARAGDTAKIVAEWKEKGIKMLKWYWTLGRYDAVVVFEAESEKEAMRMLVENPDWITTETLVAIPREEAVKLL